MTIQTTMKRVLLTAQIFSFIPVSGTMQNNIQKLKFSWKSWRMVYAFLSLAGMIFVFSIQLRKIALQSVDMVDIYKVVSYMSAISAAISFVRLAKVWPRFIKKWTVVERSMARYGPPSKLDKKVNGILMTFLAFFSVHYTFTQLDQLIKASKCKDTSLDMDTFRHFLKLKFVNVCSLFECDVIAGVLLMCTNIQIIFSHTFVDIFIMVISVSLASRLTQVTKRIKSVVYTGIKSEEIWVELREDYNRLDCLCKSINSDISSLVVLSFVRNLLMVLMQLFNSLKVRRGITERIYFYYTFGFLVIRTASVCILGSAVNDESRKSLVYLYKVRDDVYNTEVDRLLRQVSVSNMALSGMNFFRVRRDLVLKIAGALVTYELILIQFAGDILKTNNNKTSC